MHEKHTGVTTDGSKREAVRDPELPPAGALAVCRERRADVLVLWLTGALDQATSTRSRSPARPNCVLRRRLVKRT